MNLRMCEIVIDQDKLKVDLQSVFMKYTTIKKWAYILHDKDDTRPHYHIALHFGKASVDIATIASWFDLGYTDAEGKEHDGTNFIEKVKGRWAGVLKYLTHRNETQQHKHLYDMTEIVANFDVEQEIQQSEIIGDFEHYSYAQQLNYVNSLPVSEKLKCFSQLRSLWQLHCQYMSLKSDRNVRVIFISGAGGAGKTYYAKKLFNSLGYDFCISSSSNDPFQDYLGQKGMLLDDLRDYYFDFEDLLKMLDNNTSSSVKSRFSNKVFNGDLIIITSKVPLNFWYRHKDNKGNYYNFSDTDMQQLYRRINCYVDVREKEIFVYENGIGNDGKPIGRAKRYVNEVYGFKTAEVSPVNTFSQIFDNICELSESGYTQQSFIQSDENIF